MRNLDDRDARAPGAPLPATDAPADEAWLDDDETPLPDGLADAACELWDDDEPEPDAADFCLEPADED